MEEKKKGWLDIRLCLLFFLKASTFTHALATSYVRLSQSRSSLPGCCLAFFGPPRERTETPKIFFNVKYTVGEQGSISRPQQPRRRITKYQSISLRGSHKQISILYTSPRRYQCSQLNKGQWRFKVIHI